MQTFSKTSAGLRLQLIAMIILLVGPLAVFQALELAQVKSTRTRLTQQQAYDLAKAGAARYQDTIDETQTVLELLSRVSEVTGGNETSCSRFLTDTLPSRAWARSMFVADGSGKVVCGTIPGVRNFDLSQREWFRNARVSGAFSISDFVISKVTVQPSAFATLFFRNAETGEQQVIAAELDLSWIDRISASIGEGNEALVMLVDGSGIVISQFPSGSRRDFGYLPQTLRERVTENDASLFSGIDPGGRERLFGSFPLTGSKGRVVVGFDRTAAIGLIDNYIFIAAALFSAVTLLASLLVWFVGDRIFVRPVEVLNLLLQATLDTMDQGLIAINRHGRVDVINRRAMKLLDLPASFATSRPHQDEILKFQDKRGEFADREQFKQVTQDIVERRHGSYERQRPDGTVLEIRTVPTSDGGFVRTYSDITRRSEAEADLMREKERAVAASLAASEFLANMSHELRTPLTAIIGVSEMLLNGEPSPKDQQRFMLMQKNAGQALLSVINDILDFSKIEVEQLELNNEPFNLHDAISDCISIVDEAAQKKGLPLSFSIASTVPVWVQGDPTRLKQVLLNLLSNAVKFTQAGSVKCSVAMHDASQRLIQFAVADTGIGIASYDLQRIFERFSQADSSATRRFGGTGLGLAISKKLVLLMGGDLEAYSEPNNGTIFTFSIALTACEQPQVAAVERPRTQASLRLLLAEDNELNQQLIRAMLEQAGHQVQVVNDGAAAVHTAVLGQFDLVLMDVQMPELDGYAAASMIRSDPRCRNIPIIGLTANALSDEAKRCIDAGMNAYFCKPIDWVGLLATIDHLARGNCPNGTRDGGVPRHLDPLPILNPATLNSIRSSIGTEATENLLRLFLVEARELFTADASDLDHVKREAHSFGGSAAILGLERLSQACGILCTEMVSLAQCAVQIQITCQECDQAVVEIHRVLKNGVPTIGEANLATMQS